MLEELEELKETIAVDVPMLKKSKEALAVDTLEALLTYNNNCYEIFKKRPFFKMIGDGELGKDAEKRDLFFNYMQIFADNFQSMMFARQAGCYDEKFKFVFLAHLHEEIGHDDLLRQRDKQNNLFDPTLTAVAVWFIHQMTVLDNIEKTAVMHLVLEIAGDFYHSFADSILSSYLKSDYYAVHAEHDESHVQLGVNLLGGYPPFVYKRLKKLVGEAWSMMYLMVDRVHTLVMENDNE